MNFYSLDPHKKGHIYSNLMPTEDSKQAVTEAIKERR